MARNKNSIFNVELKNNQKQVLNFLKSNEISILTGDGGTGKDFCCLYRALEGVNDKEFEEIIFIKPIVQMGQSIGYLPGSETDKYEPYIKSFTDNISKITSKPFYNTYKSRFKFEPSTFLRGNTIEYSAIILSEAQNMTLHELISVITRVSYNSKLFINGDTLQSDIGRKSGLKDLIKILENVEGANTMNLGDEFQMRNKIIVDITKEYRNFLKTKI
jgi:phosphate starvation-inducible PhoH-like protein